MKYRYLITLVVFCLISCAGTSQYYNWEYSLIKPTESETLSYEDEILIIQFEVGATQIIFQLKNKGNNTIKINWDELAFISPLGESQRVIHKGVKLTDRDKLQAPTVIPATTKISDLIVPAENISFDKYSGRWIEGDLFPGQNKSEYTGKSFSVYFPIEVKNEKKEYLFTFKIENVAKKKTSVSTEEY